MGAFLMVDHGPDGSIGVGWVGKYSGRLGKCSGMEGRVE